MNAVQSFWITPESINAGGWINKRFEYIGWSLSFYLLQKNFSEVHLYCNSAGYKMLVDKLGLNYSNIYKTLDNQEKLISKSWVLAKILNFSLQEAPFVHVDGDVFWFDLPNKDFFEADTFAQCIEMDDVMYKNILQNLQTENAYLPDFLKMPNVKACLSTNMGIVGGNNLKFFKDFYHETVLFIDKNQEIFEKNQEGFSFVPIFTEQLLFIYFANYLQIKLRFLKKPAFRGNFIEVLDFNQISPVSKTPDFIHLLGSYRARLTYCNFAEFWLHKLWPGQLEKINAIYQIEKDELTGFPNFLSPEREKRLPHLKWLFSKPEEVLEYPFIRTQTIFGVSLEEYNINTVGNRELLDCAEFEEQRVKVLNNLLNATDSDTMFQHFESHLNFCLKSIDEVKALSFELNQAYILKSKFNWFNDIKYESQYYWYNLIIDSQKECFQEFLLTENECKLVEMFKDETSFVELTSAWLRKYPTQNQQKVEKTIHEMLKELINLNLIICI
ncbi:DUF6734 family protein [Emticicia sp. BO119]|uniref:DUF6734 family protein n=1 Tax=Emticicia sp. BO119 TaxID=2757768 RepID=UPI0015F0C8B5|nr:DUF6734 family protein [Emticicia sp. BO119]MBA4853042.1 hypothetical protein [Emticicia sp. BO119]